MTLPLLKLLPGVLKTIAKVAGIDIFDKAADALAGIQETPEMRQALLEHEAQMKQLAIDELKTVMSESLAMIASPDKFVSRARPSMLYVATGITAFLVIIVGITIFKAVHIDLGAIGAIVSLMTPLWGAGGYYIHKRTEEKINGGRK